MIGELLYFVPLVVAYFVVDRALSRYFTGSWWKQPRDVQPSGAEDHD